MTLQESTTHGGDVASAIDLLITALGGPAAVDAAVAQTITAEGWRRHPAWGTDPGKAEAVATFGYTVVEDAVRPRYRLSIKAHTFLVPAELDYTEVGNGSVGHVTGIDFMFDPRPVDMAIESWRVATRLRHFDLTSPLRLARKLTRPEADVCLDAEAAAGEDGEDGEVLVLREVGRPPVRIHLDPATGLPAKVAVTEEHPPLGDALVEVTFGDYRAAGSLTLPYQVAISVNGLAVHEETRSSIQVEQAVPDDRFDVPEAAVADGSADQVAYGQYSTEWVMSYVFSGVRFYFDLQVAPLTPDAVELAPGVKMVIGPSHNTLVVEMPDHLVAVEAPLYHRYAGPALAQVKAAFPGKPLRTVVATHFHYDHIGGIREFAADGDLTVICGRASAGFFEEVFRRPHTADPDRFAGRPVPVIVRAVDDQLTLPTADGGTLQVCHITSDHAEDMLIVYLSGPKIVFESDLWNPTPAMPAPGAQRGRLATQLCDAITSRGLDVETVAGGHQGSDGKTWAHAAPLSYLKTAAGY
jgi:glyoxylase-like metal-dependent hydrolase (beta-lactamase superfamily II)